MSKAISHKRKREYFNYFRERIIFIHKVLRDGALIIKLKQNHLHPANIHPERGPPGILPIYANEYLKRQAGIKEMNRVCSL